MRERLLRRVQWQLASRSAAELADDLEMQVREQLHERGWPLSAAKPALKSLIDLAFETAAKPTAADRRLTRMDLVSVLESAAGPAFLARHGPTPPALESVHGILVTEPEFDMPGAALRASAIESVARDLAASPLVWIHGTNSVGKSTFARLLARRRQGRWLALDLRPVQREPGGSVAAWRELLSSIARSGPLDGIIVDDFNDEAARGLRSRLIALCLISASSGTRVIVTSHHQPSPALLAECGSLPDAMVQAPYFSDEDVEELVRASDPPEPEIVRAWAAMIRVSTGGGHPLLTAAKIASLRARGWTRVQLDGGDMAAALTDYRKIAEIVGLWERPDVEVEVVCAQAIILDEGLGERDRAIAVLDEAIGRYGNQVGLLRQKSKVLGHAGDHAAAAKLLLEIEDVVGAESPFGRALALRDGAANAAKAERYEDALRLWRKAAEQQSQMSSRPAWFAAFKIERALALWQADRVADALAEAADVLEAIETLDPAGSRQAERTHQYGRALINLFLGDRFEDLRPRQAFSPGDASVLEADEEPLVGAVLNPLPDFWRLLAALEAQSGIDLGLERRSWAKLAGPVIAGAEIMLIEARYRSALIADDLASAIRCRFALAGVQRAIQDAGEGIGPKRVPPFDFQGSAATPLGSDAVADDAAFSGLLDVVLHRMLASGKSPDDDIRTSLSELSEVASELGGDIQTFVRILLGETKPEPRHPIAFVSAYAISLSEQAILEDPSLRLYRDMLLIRQVAGSPAKAILAPLLIRRMIDGWSFVIDEQTFLLRDPIGAIPALRAKLVRMTGQSLSGAAAFVLEAAPTVGFRFQNGWDALLMSIAEA